MIFPYFTGALIKEHRVALVERELHFGKWRRRRVRACCLRGFHSLVARDHAESDRDNGENGFRVEVWFHEP